MGTPAKAAQGSAPRSISRTNGAAVVGNPDLRQKHVAASMADDEGVIAADPEASPASADDGLPEQNTPQQIPVESSESSNAKFGSSGAKLKAASAIEEEGEGAGEIEAIGAQDEEHDDESEYEYEDDDDAAFSGFLVQSNDTGASVAAASGSSSSSAIIVDEDAAGLKTAPTGAAAAAPKKKWREPTKAAVNMSLKAEQETSGSKRRLAQDLYRIMNQDTEVAGFSLAPASEDSMDLWNIKLFQFDGDSNLAKDMLVLGIENIDLEMKFPDQYPFEPPFVRVVSPRFKRQTGFVMNGALCMELLTKEGWNPINDIESVIVSVRSLLVVGDGRIQAAAELPKERYQALLKAAEGGSDDEDDDPDAKPRSKKQRTGSPSKQIPGKQTIGSYSASEAEAAYSHLSDYHKKKGWDQSGWWSRKG